MSGAQSSSARLAGTAPRRVEDPRLLRGRAAYLEDLSPPGLLHAAFVRSPHGHARVLSVTVDDAREASGVRLALAADELAAFVQPLSTRISTPGCCQVDRPHLAGERVCFVGEPVAVVVAEDVYLARDAAELVDVAYEPLLAVATAEAALRTGAVLLHEQAPGNVFFERVVASDSDVDRVFQDAEVVVSVTLRHPRVTGLAIENRGVLADYDSVKRRLTVWSSTQAPHVLREALANCLGLARERIRVVVPDVGGGFGTKVQIYPEEIVVAAAAVRLGRPVRWAEDRLENLLAATHARDTRIHAELAARRDGTLLAMRSDVVCAVGAYGVHPAGPILEPIGTATMVPGPYLVPRYRYRTRGVATNASPEGAYRGVGVVVAALAHERMIDELARALGLDPAEVRRRNLIPSERFPYPSAGGHLYDSGSYREGLDRALALVGYEAWRAEQARLRAQGRYLGIGIACYTEYTGMGSSTYQGRGMLDVPGHETARLSLGIDGILTASLSQPAIGQGSQTTLGQMLADRFGVPLAQVALLGTDTALTPEGSGTFASRGAVVAGGALCAASDRLAERLLPIAAELLEASAEDVELVDGRVLVRGVPERSVSLAQIAAHTAAGPNDETRALDVVGVYDSPAAAYSAATHVAVVEVDVETGLIEFRAYAVVEDCGPVINPTIVEGQVHGAVAQGIGGALLEELVYDPEGQLLSATLMDYLVPSSTELPNVELDHLETPSPFTVGGHKGVGEGGTVGASAAVANAVADALTPLGVLVTELPLSPERVRALVRGSNPSPTPPRGGEGGRRGGSRTAPTARRRGAAEGGVIMAPETWAWR